MENKSNSKVTVFIPVYNAEHFLRETLDSVLGQSYSDLVYLLSDDASNDNSAKILSEYTKIDGRIKAIYHEDNCGVAKRRNEALKDIETKYIAFADADDIMSFDRIEKQLAFMEQHSNCDIVFAGYQKIREDGTKFDAPVIDEWSTQSIEGEIFFHNMIPMGTVMLRRDSIRNKGLLFDENLVTLSDYNFWVDCLLAGMDFCGLPDVMQLYRIVASGLSVTNSYGEKLKLRENTFDAIREKYLNHYNITLSSKQKKIIFGYIRNGNVSKLKRIKDAINNLMIYLKFRKSPLWNNLYFRRRYKEFMGRYYHL